MGHGQVTFRHGEFSMWPLVPDEPYDGFCFIHSITRARHMCFMWRSSSLGAMAASDSTF